MKIAILSPCLLYFDADIEYAKKIRYLTNVEKMISTIIDYTDLRIDWYDKSPFSGSNRKIPDYGAFTLNNYATNIYSKIQKIIARRINLEKVKPVTLSKKLSLPNNNSVSAFCSYLNYLNEEKTLPDEAVLFVSEQNLNLIRTIDIVENEGFEIKLSTLVDREFTIILLPFLKEECQMDEIFPRKNFCKVQKYNEYVLKKKDKMNQGEKIALFEKMGKVVAIYNGYKESKHLERMNRSIIKKELYLKKKEERNIIFLWI